LECLGVADPIAGLEVAHTRGERDATVKKEFEEFKEGTASSLCRDSTNFQEIANTLVLYRRARARSASSSAGH
jgi:hypothetical protein